MRVFALILTAVLTAALVVPAVAQERPEDVNATHEDAPYSTVIGGADRYETAANIARQTFPQDHTQILYVANGDTLADALVVGVTNERASKMLLVRRDEVPEPTREALQALSVWRVVFLGGDAAISPEVREEVLELVNTWR